MVRVNFPLPKANVMSDQTPLLSLPLIQGSQAQKHVTHNEAIEQLDMVVQLTVEAVDASTPPSGAAEGQAWAVGDGATGAWAGRSGQVAAWRGGGWLFATPQTGWRAWNKSAAATFAFDGAAWVYAAGAPDLQNLDGLGVNTTADATNKLAVASDATLLNHDGAGHQVKINKSDATDTASLLYQTNFSGRAEMGLTGNDDFSVKVSADGSNFTEAMRINGATGAVNFPATGMHQIASYAYRHYLYNDHRWAAPISDTASKLAFLNLGTAAEPIVNWTTGGILLSSGTKLHGFSLSGYLNHAEVQDLDIRIYFQTGPWNSTWDSVGETLRTTLFSQNNIGMTLGVSQQRKYIPLSYTTPADGTFFIALRPTMASTMTGTRFFYASGNLEMSAASLSA